MTFLKYLFTFIIIFSSYVSYSQSDTQDTSLVNWVDLGTAEAQFKAQPKPYLIDVYTDWCSWCKYMTKMTYNNPNIAGYINTNFYPVKFNSEKTDSVDFQGKTYRKVGKTNQLANTLLNGRLSYPTTVFISRSGQKIAVPGYKSPVQIEPYLVYFAENLDIYIDIQSYLIAHMFTYPRNFKDDIAAIPDSLKPDTSATCNWITFNRAFTKATTEPRKYILFTSTSWNFSHKVMKKITFSDSIIASLVNENFYIIDFDAATEDTISVNGKQYVSMGKGQPNQLAMELMKGNFQFPAMIILDEDFKPITVINGYFSALQLEPILQFFITEKYKTITFQQFMQTFKSQRK